MFQITLPGRRGDGERCGSVACLKSQHLGSWSRTLVSSKLTWGLQSETMSKNKVVGRDWRDGPDVKSTVCFSRGLGSIPNTHMASSGLSRQQACNAHSSHTYTGKTPMHKKNKSKKRMRKREGRAGKVTPQIKCFHASMRTRAQTPELTQCC